MARLRVKEQPRLPVGTLDLLWKAARRWGLALVVASFPFLFIFDDAVRLPLSPVLPGLVLLALLLIGLPFAWMELSLRRARRRDPVVAARRALRHAQAGNIALGLAGIWFVAWLSLGA